MTESTHTPPQGQTPGGSPHGHGLDDLYTALRRPGVHRDPDGRWFAGVCTGVARWLGVDALVVRAGFILLSIFFGLGVALYLAAWLLLPDERAEIHLERALKHGEGGSIVLLVATAVTLLGGGPWWGGDTQGVRVGGFVVLGVGAWWFLTRTDSGRRLVGRPWGGPGRAPGASGTATGTDAAAGASAGAAAAGPASVPFGGPSTGNAAANAGAVRSAAWSSVPVVPPAPRPVVPRARSIGFAPGLLALGAAVLTGALVAQLAREHVWGGNAFAVGVAAGVAVLGIAVVVTGLAGRRAGALPFFAVVGLVAALVATAAPPGLTQPWQVGPERHVVTSLTPAPAFQLALGEMRVDLTGADYATTAARPDTVDVTVGVGQLDLVVPKGANVVVNTRARAGALEASGTTEGAVLVNTDGGTQRRMRSDGMGFSRTVTYGTATATPDIVVDVELGVGEIRVTQAAS